MLEGIEIRACIERKGPRLPRYVVIPAVLIKPWELVGTTSVEAWLNGRVLGRRTLKRWDDERWFLEVTQAQCDEAHVDTGAEVIIRVRLSSAEPPTELTRLLEEHAAARMAWDGLSAPQQRALLDHVAIAKMATTRWKRAAAGLGVKVAAPPDLTVRRRGRGGPPLRVEVHTVEVAEDDPRTPSRGIELIANWFADEIFCDSWLEALNAAGADPATAGPPPELRRRPEVWEQFLSRRD